MQLFKQYNDLYESLTHTWNLLPNTFWLHVIEVRVQRHNCRILAVSRKFSATPFLRVGWEVPDGMAWSPITHMVALQWVSGYPSWFYCVRKKNWMLEQPVKTNDCSSIQLLLWQFCWWLNYCFKRLQKVATVFFHKKSFLNFLKYKKSKKQGPEKIFLIFSK